MAVETDLERVTNILSNRRTPAWYEGAKFGLCVNWGLFSIPAWAPKSGPLAELLNTHYSEANKLSPHAAWYWNGMRIEGSPTWRYHQDVWKGRPYEDFREEFSVAVDKWDPAAWAQTFKAAGARYIIFNAKHHDGYLLWPSQTPNPKRDGWQSQRDIVGELAEAVRKQGMEFGLYYSGGLDWTFDEDPIIGGLDVFSHVPSTPEYARYVISHYRELIERYRPTVLWNDIGIPEAPDLHPLLYYYVTHVQEGVINDRFNTIGTWFHWLKRSRVRKMANVVGRLRGSGTGALMAPPESPIANFRTSEDASRPMTGKAKWELARSLGNSHAWNRAETEADLIGGDELVHILADVTAKNGNLLLEIGADDTGAVPVAPRARLETVGRWLQSNGEAIYGTGPWWARAEGTSTDGLPLRFTAKPGMVYAILLGTPTKSSVTMENMPQLKADKIELLGHGAVETTTEDRTLTVSWPPGLEKQPAYVIKLVLEEEADD